MKLEKELKLGDEYAKPVIDLFIKGDLNKVTATFSEISKNPKITPVMKLVGYSFVFYSFERMHRYDSSILYQDSCINIIEQNKLQADLPFQYSNFLLSKSATLFKLHQPEKANELFFKAKNFSAENNTINNQYALIEKLGYIAYQQQNFRESLENFKQAKIFHDKIDTITIYKKVELISNVGLCFFHLGKYDSALLVYRQALQYLNNHADNVGPGTTDSAQKIMTYHNSKGVLLGNMANVYTKLGFLDTAIVLSKQSIVLNNTQGGERRDALLVAIRLVDIYISQKKWALATDLLSLIEKILITLPDEVARMNWNRQKATVWEAASQPGKAFYYFKEYNRINDSINTYQGKDAESNIIKDLQIKNQDADLALLKKNNQLNKLYLWITIGMVIMALIIAALVYINYKKFKKSNIILSRLNDEIMLQKVALENANREKDRIMNIVAHDLRNPIGGIAALSKNMMDDIECGNDNQQDFIPIIHKTASNSLLLINELLEMHATDYIQLNKEQTDIIQLLSDCIIVLTHKAVEKNQQFIFEKDVDQLQLSIDKSQIERVVQNLLMNAIKFSQPNSSICLSVTKTNDKCFISVRDNGIGIPDELKEQLFSIFSTAKRKGTAGEKSFGIGLSVCKRIIEAHGGLITVESKVGEGSIFNIALPIESALTN